MIVVLSDDFSGAIEIAEIGFRYGLNLEIQSDLNLEKELDMVVLNTKSRSLKEYEAVKKIETVCYALLKSPKPVKIFNKISSTMRGNIVPELDVLQYHFQYDKILMIPVNPSRGETIRQGQYYLNGIKLNESVMANDLMYPAKFAHLEDMISDKEAIFNHTHIQSVDLFPEEGLVTGDVLKSSDIKPYVELMKEFDLICGSSECFMAYLEVNGFECQKSYDQKARTLQCELIVDGSTRNDQIELSQIKNSSFEHLLLPSGRKGNSFEIQSLDKKSWYNEVGAKILAQKRIYISIEHAEKYEQKLADLFLEWFIGLTQFLHTNNDIENILIGITGGTTADIVLTSLDIESLKVETVLTQGVAIISDANDPNQKFLVKPGKYPWPEVLMA